MPSYVALLRAVNITGHNGLAMRDLRQLLEALPAQDVRTYLQSGNAVFRSGSEDLPAVGSALHDAIASKLGLAVDVLVRTGEDLQRVVNDLPFRSDSMVYVTFLASAPGRAKVAALAAHDAAIAPPARRIVAPDDRDAFCLAGREIYLSCPNGYGRTKLNNAMFERQLGVVATTRNWRTVTTLAQMASG
ncbi:MAG: DUF1697 domain-containing protein [Acidimicrobiales bacterium]